MARVQLKLRHLPISAPDGGTALLELSFYSCFSMAAAVLQSPGARCQWPTPPEARPHAEGVFAPLLPARFHQALSSAAIEGGTQHCRGTSEPLLPACFACFS